MPNPEKESQTTEKNLETEFEPESVPTLWNIDANPSEEMKSFKSELKNFDIQNTQWLENIVSKTIEYWNPPDLIWEFVQKFQHLWQEYYQKVINTFNKLKEWSWIDFAEWILQQKIWELNSILENSERTNKIQEIWKIIGENCPNDRFWHDLLKNFEAKIQWLNLQNFKKLIDKIFDSVYKNKNIRTKPKENFFTNILKNREYTNLYDDWSWTVNRREIKENSLSLVLIPFENSKEYTIEQNTIPAWLKACFKTKTQEYLHKWEVYTYEEQQRMTAQEPFTSQLELQKRVKHNKKNNFVMNYIKTEIKKQKAEIKKTPNFSVIVDRTTTYNDSLERIFRDKNYLELKL